MRRKVDMSGMHATTRIVRVCARMCLPALHRTRVQLSGANGRRADEVSWRLPFTLTPSPNPAPHA